MTQKLFGTDGIRGVFGEYPLTRDIVFRVGRVIPKMTSNAKVVIGRDTRASGMEIETILAAGILSSGGTPILLGVVPTPMVSHFTRILGADMGCVITASHNPSEYNGIKLFSSNGIKLTDREEDKIEKMILIETSCYDEKPRDVKKMDVAEEYVDFLARSVGCRMAGLNVIVDAANGSYSSIAGKVLEKLGARVKIVFDKPNGNNINSGCGATNTSAIAGMIKQGRFDAGISLDGDGDRVMMTDETGNVVDGDQMMGICAINMKDSGALKKNTLVATEYSNMGLEVAMRKNGIMLVPVKNGDRYVLDEMMKNGYNLGGEMTGHIIFTDKMPTGDGMLTALQILSIMRSSGKKLSELAGCVTKYPQIIVNVKVREKRDFCTMPDMEKVMESVRKKLGNDGKLLIRYSGTENLLRIMVEGRDMSEIRRMAESIAAEARKAIGA